MQFHFDERIEFPAPMVYETLRDRTPDLVPYLPEVDSIRTTSREQLPAGHLRLINIWQGNRRSAPFVARPFLSRDMLQWKDTAVWNDTDLSLQWCFETTYMESLFSCNGKNYFEALSPTTCQFHVTGTLETFPSRIPGISVKLGQKVAPKAEEWLIDLIMPNIARMPGALTALLKES